MKVVVADDHRLVRRSLVRLLERLEDIYVVGEAAGGEEALEQTRKLEPDILLLDVNMDDMDGLEVLGELQGQSKPRVVMVSMHTDRSLVKRALAAGAVGYVSKRAVADELGAAVRAVASGRTYLCRRVRAQLYTH